MLFKKPYKTLMTRHLNDDIADSEDMAKAVYEASMDSDVAMIMYCSEY